MNNPWFTGFIILLIIFIFFSFFWERLSLKDILKLYFDNYYGGEYEKNGELKRKIAPNGLIVLGLSPYLLGACFFLSLQDFCIELDYDYFFQINLIIITIISLFYGLNINVKEENIRIKKETEAVMLVNVLLIILNTIILMLISLFSSTQNEEIIFKIIFMALEFKILILFIYIIRRINIMKQQ